MTIENDGGKKTPDILKQLLSRNNANHLNKTTQRNSYDTMSIRKIDYSEIFKNSAYRKLVSKKLPEVTRIPIPKKPILKKLEVNKSVVSFPNSDMTLDITTAFDKDKQSLK
jgi:hypothetical protein